MISLGARVMALSVLILAFSVSNSPASSDSSDTSKSVTQQFEKPGTEKSINQGLLVSEISSIGTSTIELMCVRGILSVETGRMVEMSSSATGYGDDIEIDEGGLERTIDCRGRNVIVNGGDNKLTLRGECNSLTVPGSGNKITVDAVGTIKTEGNDNEVTWTKGLGGKNPKISNPGKGNVIRQAKN